MKKREKNTKNKKLSNDYKLHNLIRLCFCSCRIPGDSYPVANAVVSLPEGLALLWRFIDINSWRVKDMPEKDNGNLDFSWKFLSLVSDSLKIQNVSRKKKTVIPSFMHCWRYHVYLTEHYAKLAGPIKKKDAWVKGEGKGSAV